MSKHSHALLRALLPAMGSLLINHGHADDAVHASAVNAGAPFSVIEFRRYTIVDGERENFAHYFDSYFPDAFQQLGAMPFGQFLQRDNTNQFVWLRGFANTEARAIVNTAFYYGPLWKEHSGKMNARLIDHTNVLLLQPLSTEQAIPALPAVDPVKDVDTARGMMLALLLPTNADQLDPLITHSAPVFNTLRKNGVRDAGLLKTLDIPNSFPRLPYRTDGHWLVWLGLVKDEQQLQKIRPLIAGLQEALKARQLVRAETELLVLNPTARSRLRWLPPATQ